MKIDPRVYIYDEDDCELEVDMELVEDGYPYAVYMSGPMSGEEIKLSDSQITEARDKFLEWVKFGGGPNGESYYLNACATLAAVTRWIEGEDK